jgi:NADH-quinone oxidoreductase subunit M
MILLPLLGAFAILIVPCRHFRLGRILGLCASLLAFLIWLYLLQSFRGVFGFEFSEFTVWIRELGIHYWIGMDGVSFFLVGLTVLLSPLALGLFGKSESSRSSWILVLMIESVLIGLFSSLDLFLCYLFLECAIVLLFFLLRRESVDGAKLFFVFNISGSAVVLLCLVVLSRQAGGSFDLATLAKRPLPEGQQLIWGGLFIAALILKSGLIPLQVWLRDLMREASPATLIIIVGLFLKAGAYLAFRFGYPLFPRAFEYYSEALFLLGFINLFGGGLLMLARRSLRDCLTFMTVGHMGLVWMGIALLKVNAGQGALYFLVSHGIVFAVLGLILHTQLRPHSSEAVVDQPVEASVLDKLLVTLAALILLGLPGTSFFISLFLVLWAALSKSAVLTVLSLAGWMLIAGVMIYSFRSIRFDTLYQRSIRFWVVLTTLILIVGFSGVMPAFFLERSRTAMTLWLSKVNPEIQLQLEDESANANPS